MVEVQALQQHIKNYRNTRQIYIEYRKSGYSKKFFEEHRQEITIHKAAKQAFDELQITKLPSMQSLYEEFHQLAVQKKQDYAEYRQIRKEKEELLIAKRTVETILNIDKQKEQEKVNSLIEDTQKKIQESSEKIEDAQSDVESIDAKIGKMIEYEKQLEIQKAKEDATRLAAIKKQEQENRSNVTYAPAQSDAYLLAAIIQCEAWGESYDGKLAVGSVIMNRVRSSYFPNTVSGVIYQGGQFSPVASGRLAYRLEQGVASDCMSAAQAVLGGTSTTNCLYFRVNNGIIEGTVIGNHVFY